METKKPEEKRRLRLSIKGRVQGVFFRDSVRRVAATRGVNGWARNQPDGSVEVVVEGELTALERVAAFCRKGPSRARVDHVEVAEERVEGLAGFHVL